MTRQSPNVTSSPDCSRALVTRSPLTVVPRVEPRSTTWTSPGPVASMTPCMRDTVSSSRRRSEDASFPILDRALREDLLAHQLVPFVDLELDGDVRVGHGCSPLAGSYGKRAMAVSGLLDVLERLQHLGNEVLANLDEAGMLRLLLRADELAVRALKVALDGVVLEVVDGLGFVLDVIVARGSRSARREPPAAWANTVDGAARAIPPRRAKPMMSGFFMIRFSLVLQEVRLLGVRQPKRPRGSVQNPTFVAFIKPL